MRSSAQITSNLQHIIVDSHSDCGKLSIGKRGVLLSVLGNDLVGSEVTSKLDKTLSKTLKGKEPFFEFESKDLDKNHLCVSYQEESNTVYIIGIDDLVISFATPTNISSDKIKGIAVKLKAETGSGLIAQHVILVRLEGKIGRSQKLAFYLVNAAE